MNAQIEFEETPQRLKVVIPINVGWLPLALHTVALLVWVGMLVIVLVYLFGGRSNSFVLTTLLLVWLLIWLWFGRFLWRRWQYHVATREILFIDEEQLVLRRPVSLLGLTTAYDFQNVSPFYFSDKHSCPAFDYAYLHVYFGRSLPADQARELVAELNKRCFPEVAAGVA